jgi:hypothetical protein
MTFAGTSAGTFPTGLVFFFLLMLIVPRDRVVRGAVGAGGRVARRRIADLSPQLERWRI